MKGGFLFMTMEVRERIEKAILASDALEDLQKCRSLTDFRRIIDVDGEHVSDEDIIAYLEEVKAKYLKARSALLKNEKADIVADSGDGSEAVGSTWITITPIALITI